jgi:hypothetical protein
MSGKGYKGTSFLIKKDSQNSYSPVLERANSYGISSPNLVRSISHDAKMKVDRVHSPVLERADSYGISSPNLVVSRRSHDTKMKKKRHNSKNDDRFTIMPLSLQHQEDKSKCFLCNKKITGILNNFSILKRFNKCKHCFKYYCKSHFSPELHDCVKLKQNRRYLKEYIDNYYSNLKGGKKKLKEKEQEKTKKLKEKTKKTKKIKEKTKKIKEKTKKLKEKGKRKKLKEKEQDYI